MCSTAGFSTKIFEPKNQMPWKIFIFTCSQAYHWKLLIEIRPNPVRLEDWAIPSKVKNSKILNILLTF
jgi:hypothetical protein